MTYPSNNPEFSRVSYDTFTPANLPTTDPEGTVYFDSQRGVPAWWDGDNHEWANFVDDVLLTQQTVQNTTTRTSVWNPDINANSLIKGRIYQIDLHGTFGTANNSDQFTVDVDLAGTDVAGVQNAGANVDAGTPWTLELTFTVRDHGASGVLKANTRATFNEQPRTANHAEVTVDTTTATQLEIFITWGATNTDNVVNVEQAHLKQMA